MVSKNLSETLDATQGAGGQDMVDANQWTCSGILKGLLAVFIYVLPYTLLHTYQNLLDPLVP